MELLTVDVTALHIPAREWRWLRPAVHISVVKSAPVGFLWGARVGDAIWAWHPRGYSLDVAGMSVDAKVRVLLLKTDHSECEAHGLFLRTTFEAQPAHDVEWVAALQTLTQRLGWDPTSRGLPPHWKEALEACGLEPHLGVLAQRNRYAFLNEQEEQLVFERRWDLATLELLESLTAEVRAQFIASAKRWNLTAGHAKEALNFALILSRKMSDKTALTVLSATTYKNAEEFRMALFRTAQPELATLTQKRIQLLRSLNAPARSSVYGDPSFESDILKITHNPRKLVDFEVFRAWIAEAETLDKIRELLEIYQ